ncbi:MAG: LLM class flavin-dependent oxidoreductase [Chloroflexota bacterium]
MSSPDRVALYLQDAHPLADGIQYVQYAEAKGFEAVWQAESRLVRDAIVPMAAFAATTQRIKVASGVINNWTRNIGLLAATFLTLDDLAQDRIICGIGAWWDPLASKVGINRRKPLLAMRETVEVLRRLLNMENVTFHGEFHHVDGIQLDVVHGRREPRHVPIYIGATGMTMMELAGEIADGVCLNYLVHPSYNLQAMEALERGAKRAGRRLEDIDRPQLVICSVDLDRQKALDGARKMMTQYLGQQPHLMKASGVSQELLDEIHQVLTWPATDEEIEGAMHLVPDDVVQMCTASGSPEEVKAKVREYIAHGATCPILYPLGDPKLMIDIFSEGYSA